MTAGYLPVEILAPGGISPPFLTEDLGGVSQHPLHKIRVDFNHISVEMGRILTSLLRNIWSPETRTHFRNSDFPRRVRVGSYSDIIGHVPGGLSGRSGGGHWTTLTLI